MFTLYIILKALMCGLEYHTFLSNKGVPENCLKTIDRKKNLQNKLLSEEQSPERNIDRKMYSRTT